MDKTAFANLLPTPRTHASNNHTTFVSRFRTTKSSFVQRRSTTTPHRNAPVTPSMMANVVIAGGTGFIGTRLTTALLARGDSVTILTRKPSPQSLPVGASPQKWNPTNPDTSSRLQTVLRAADAVINLCGEPVVTRWSPDGKAAILASRLNSTNALTSAMRALPAGQRPTCFVCASAIGYYGTDVPYDTVVDEGASMGSDFLAGLCQKWEDAARGAQSDGIRTVSLRLGIVLGVAGGALARMIPAFQFFLGGPLGSGRQWVPWVHVDDVVAAFVKAVDDSSMSGVYNCTAANTVTMSDMCAALGRALGRPSLFPVPDVVVKLALGEASSVLLEGQQVAPTRLLQAGFKFQYEDVDSAMQAVARDL